MPTQSQSDHGISRRQFIEISGATLGAGMAFPGILAASTLEKERNPLFDSKLGVQFIVGGMVHETAHEGPCRVGNLSDLTYDAELAGHRRAFDHFISQFQNWHFPDEVDLLEPVPLKMLVRKKNVEFELPNEEFLNIEGVNNRIDVFVVVRSFVSDICVELANRYNKPVIALAYEGEPHRGPGWVVDAPAAVRHLGKEAHAAYDREDLNRILRLMWVRKAFAETKLLIVTDRLGKAPFGLSSAAYDFSRLRQLFGMRYHNISNQELADEMERTIHSESMQKRIEDFAAKVMHQAIDVHMSKEHIIHSAHFYYAVRHLMNKFECNAFTVECREICPLEIAAHYQFTPCMTLSLLKDAGYPAVCQTDINALLAMMALSYLGRRTVYMGNPDFFAGNNTVTIFHDVAGLKMKGFQRPDAPYEIRNFTVGGWGVTLRYDFNRDKGETVTIARFNPAGDRVLITRGTIVDGFGVEQISCSLGVTVQVPDAKALFKKSANYGGHLVMAYGDYIQDICDLSDFMPFHVETV
ncbi:MAG: hypothetical protein JW829_04385 [Pirellulales bacterium]|nr:hypothetical protein [Pirellulales bacterium]